MSQQFSFSDTSNFRITDAFNTGLRPPPHVDITTRMSKSLHSLTHKMNFSIAFLAAALLLATAPVSRAQSNAPVAKPVAPVAPPLTPEQKAFMDAAHHTSSDMPFPKVDLTQLNKDGTPNPNFCTINAGFRAQHEAFLKRKAAPIGVLFIGDSITAAWAGAGHSVWTNRYTKLDAANFGISGDRTEHVLWRIANGELDGISPKVVILMIGTNNNNEPAPRITAGVTAIVKQIHEKLPQSKLLLLGIFPRGALAKDPIRAKMAAVNVELAKLSNVTFLQIWEPFLTEGGTISKDVMADALHPTTRGYQIWAEAMQPALDALLK